MRPRAARIRRRGIDFVYTYRYTRIFYGYTNFIIISPQATLSAILHAVLSTAHLLIVIILSCRAFHSLSTKTHNLNRDNCSRQPTALRRAFLLAAGTNASR